MAPTAVWRVVGVILVGSLAMGVPAWAQGLPGSDGAFVEGDLGAPLPQGMPSLVPGELDAAGLPSFIPGMASPPTAPTVASRPASWPGGDASFEAATTLAPPARRGTARARLLPPGTEGGVRLVQATAPLPAASGPLPAAAAPGAVPRTAGAPAPSAAAPLAGTEASNPSFQNVPGVSPQLPTGELRDIDAATIIARVNSDVILAAEVLGAVNEILAQNADKISPGELETVRRQLMQRRLEPLIETRLLYADALRQIPPDNIPKVEDKLREEFEKEPLKRMMKQAKVATRVQLDEQLRQFGSSLDREREMFLMQTMARQWLLMQAKADEVVSRQEMLDHYQAHLADYERPARARWQELFVRGDRFPTRDEARRAIARLGNQLIDGAPFEEIARQHSDGAEQAAGGLHEWTTQGSLAAEVLDRALFELPVGGLSPVLESPRGYHIVRVLEREEAGRIGFSETQDEIKRKLIDQRREVARQEYLEKLRGEAYIWTIFDAPTGQLATDPAGRGTLR